LEQNAQVLLETNIRIKMKQILFRNLFGEMTHNVQGLLPPQSGASCGAPDSYRERI